MKYYLGISRECLDALTVKLRYRTAVWGVDGLPMNELELMELADIERLQDEFETICEPSRDFWREELPYVLAVDAETLALFGPHADYGEHGVAQWICDSAIEAEARAMETLGVETYQARHPERATLTPYNPVPADCGYDSAKSASGGGQPPVNWGELVYWLKASLLWLFRPESALSIAAENASSSERCFTI